MLAFLKRLVRRAHKVEAVLEQRRELLKERPRDALQLGCQLFARRALSRRRVPAPNERKTGQREPQARRGRRGGNAARVELAQLSPLVAARSAPCRPLIVRR